MLEFVSIMLTILQLFLFTLFLTTGKSCATMIEVDQSFFIFGSVTTNQPVTLQLIRRSRTYRTELISSEAFEFKSSLDEFDNRRTIFQLFLQESAVPVIEIELEISRTISGYNIGSFEIHDSPLSLTHTYNSAGTTHLLSTKYSPAVQSPNFERILYFYSNISLIVLIILLLSYICTNKYLQKAKTFEDESLERLLFDDKKNLEARRRRGMKSS